MGILSRLLGKKNMTTPQADEVRPPEKTVATVELRSPVLLAFDLPSEGVRYPIPDFRPGLYNIPETS